MKINVKGITKYVLVGATLTLVGLGIGKAYRDNTCPIKSRHKHFYKDSNGYLITLEQEKDSVKDYTKLEDYELIFDDTSLDIETDLFLRGFVKIENNLGLINYYEDYLSGERYYKASNGVELKGEYGFFAYKIEKIDNGEYIFKESPYVRSLYHIMEEYPYIRKDNFFELVNANEIIDNSKTL